MKRSRPAATPADRPARVMWFGLIALALVRVALTFQPGMWMWGLNLQRFLDPALAWIPWSLAALLLVPRIAKTIEPFAARFGDRLAAGSPLTLTIAVLLVGALAWGSPDNTRFVGDFLLRQGTVEEEATPSIIFPQALPLDITLHVRLGRLLQSAHLLSANTSARVLGALEAALLAVCAAWLVRALALRGLAALAAWAVVVFGGYLGMFTGYSKSLAEMVVLVVALAAFGVRMATSGRGALGLGLTLACGLALHRSALVFLPPALLAWVLAARHGGRALWRRPGTWVALAMPLGTLAVFGPRMLNTIRTVDAAVHLAPAEVRREGLFAAAFAGARALDAINLVLLLSPLVLLAALAWLTRTREQRVQGGASAGAVLLTLALPLVAIIPFIHPAQGTFRDWDDFAATGAALSAVAAWLVGSILTDARAWRWVAIPAFGAVLMTSAQWLALHTDVDQGMARARAFVTEPPARSDIERAGVWDFLGIRNFRLQHWEASAEAFSFAAVSAPSPRLLQEWALAETMAEHLPRAEAVYQVLVSKDPKNPSAWLGLAAVASRIPDVDESFRAARRLLELSPGDAGGQQIMEYLKRTYPNHP
jgi:tetratricopeptide (TPR) repeat protein